MSRSTKKPYFTQTKPRSPKTPKQIANQKVNARVTRAIEDESLDIADGNAYRKVENPYNIRDWSFHAPKDKKAYRK